MRQILLAGLALLFLNVADAKDLSAPFTLENTQVLPGGVRNPRFMDFNALLETRYGGGGEQQPLGFRLNKNITWQDVLDAKGDDQTQKNLILGKLQDLSKQEGRPITLDDLAGAATGIVKARANVQVPVLGIGITDNLTLALAVPIVHVDVKADTGYLNSEDAQKFIELVCKSSPDKCNDAVNQLNDATQRKLARLHYQPLRSETISGVGDVQLISKYRWINNSSNGLATKLGVVFPTGSATNPDKALDITTGDNRFQIVTGVMYDRNIWGDLGSNLSLAYTAQLPNLVVKRVPKNEIDSLSDNTPGDKQQLTRELSHLISLNAMLNYKWRQTGLTFTGGYNFQSLSRTRYSGPSSDPAHQHRYLIMSELEPDQILHSAVMAVGFSTVEWYQQKKFALPFQVNAVYSKPFAGRNAPNNQVLAGEMVLFF